MYVDVVRYLLPVHFRAEDRVLKHQVLGNDSGFQDFAAAINVLDVGVDGFDALFEAALQDLPFCRRDDARDDVEGDETFLRLGVAVDRKRDADAAEEQLGLTAAEIERIGRDLLQPLR